MAQRSWLDQIDNPTACEELERLERRLMGVRKLVKALRTRERDDDTWLQLHALELHEMVGALQKKVALITGRELFQRFREQTKEK